MANITAHQRSDPSVAEAVIRAAFEDVPGGAARSYVEFLAAAIDYLVARHNDRWGTTLFQWGVRLNVGQVECLVLHRGGIRVLLSNESAPADTKFDGVTYVLAPGCEMTTIPISELSQALPALRESQLAALSSAANRPALRNVRGAHSTGVTEFLTQFLGRRVPNPSYVPSALDSGDDAGSPQYLEGSRFDALATRWERDRRARDACISHYGPRCTVCGMCFGERYGKTVDGLIHIHHLVPVSENGTEHQVDPIKDLRPVCPNCHAVIHYGESVLSIEQARALWASGSSPK